MKNLHIGGIKLTMFYKKNTLPCVKLMWIGGSRIKKQQLFETLLPHPSWHALRLEPPLLTFTDLNLSDDPLFAVIVGHVPREMNRHVWYAIREGAEFFGLVKSVAPRPS